MIAVDWGTSSFRAYRVAADGVILERRAAACGILHVPDGDFAAVLEAHAGDWMDAGAGPVVMSGMIGSRQGWAEAPYASCPAGSAEIAAALIPVRWATARRAWIVPGVMSRDAAGVPDVMRGEETQIIGALAQLGEGAHTLCLPGTHSKWVRLEGGRIVRFATHMTGEMFAVLTGHSILGRLMTEQGDDAGFAAGLARSRDGEGLLHQLFAVRSLGLCGDLPAASLKSYLSGLLIGSELVAGTRDCNAVALLGAEELTARYAHALDEFGIAARVLDADAAAHGLYRIARQLDLS